MRKFLAAAATALPIVFAGVAEGHGYTQNPPSRSSNRARAWRRTADRFSTSLRASKGRRASRVAAPPTARCALPGPNSPSSTIREGNVAGKDLPSGANFTFTWTLTAAHATTSFRYFVTKNGWNPSRPLTGHNSKQRLS